MRRNIESIKKFYYEIETNLKKKNRFTILSSIYSFESKRNINVKCSITLYYLQKKILRSSFPTFLSFIRLSVKIMLFEGFARVLITI